MKWDSYISALQGSPLNYVYNVTAFSGSKMITLGQQAAIPAQLVLRSAPTINLVVKNF